ncbi:MAG: hypothetical protein ACFCUM_07015 [Bacteroidales bacterium]
MKSTTITIILLFILVTVIKAQFPIIVREDSLKVGNNQLPGLTVIIPEVEYQRTIKNWVKAMESGTRSKVVDEGGKMTIFGANIRSISQDPVNIYSELRDGDSALFLTAVFELRKDVYVERATGEDEFAKVRNHLLNFAKDQYISLVSEQIWVEEKKLRDLEKDLRKLERGESRLERSIRSNNRRISSERGNLTELNNSLRTLSAEIIVHKTRTNSSESVERREEQTKHIKNLEKDQKRTIRSIKRSENRIRKAEKSINKARREIPKSDVQQYGTSISIAEQEAVVQKFTNKLQNIKEFK